VLTSTIRCLSGAAALSLTIGLGLSTAFAADAPAAGDVPPTAGAQTPAPEVSPPVPPTQAPPAADSPCGKAMAGLLAGDPNALTVLSDAQRKAVVEYGRAPLAFSCLAIADDKEAYCAVLAKAGKASCTNNWRLVHDLKAQPAGADALPFIAEQFHHQCTTEFSKAECDKFKAAIGSGDAAKCKGVPAAIDGLCAALATGNDSLCPKDDADCRKTTAAVNKAKKKGLAAVDLGDPILSRAATNGRAECKPLIDDLALRCAAQ